MTRYLLNLLVLLDIAINVLLGGDPAMTLSARMGRSIQQGRCRFCRPVCKLLGLLESDHCAKSLARHTESQP